MHEAIGVLREVDFLDNSLLKLVLDGGPIKSNKLIEKNKLIFKLFDKDLSRS